MQGWENEKFHQSNSQKVANINWGQWEEAKETYEREMFNLGYSDICRD